MDNLPDNHTTDILLIGLNHTTASVEVRECFAFSPQEADTALETLIKNPVIEEVMLLSTCNRVEILLTTGDPPAAEKAVSAFLSQSKTIPYEEFKDFVVNLTDWWDEDGRNRERIGELIQRLGMRSLLEALGLDPDPRMVNTPRYNPYIFFKEDEVEGGWTRDVADFRSKHQA